MAFPSSDQAHSFGPVDAAFSFRLEVAEMSSPEAIDALRIANPREDVDAQTIAGGVMAYAGKGSPLNHVVGMGLHGPVSSEEFGHVEEFYRRRDAVCEVVVSPYADMSLIRHLAERNYHVTEWNSVLVRTLLAGEGFDSTEIDVRVVRPDGLREFCEIVAEGFSDAFPAEMFVPLAGLANNTCLLAYVDGQPAGGGSVAVFTEWSMAGLYGASTLPRFRNRGVQNALFRARLGVAAAAGCEIAVVGSDPGSGTQRNAERHGFRLAYTKVAMQQKP